MGRKRKAGQRQPNGQPHRPPDVSQTILKRGRDAALAWLRAREFGTAYGQMFLAREITQAEFDAAAGFASLILRYRAAIGGPARVVAAPVEKGIHGQPRASQDASQDEWAGKAVEKYDRTYGRLQMRGADVANATVKLCADEYLTWAEREWAKIGLGQLAVDAGGGRREKGA